LLGRYENFPQIIHAVARVTFFCSTPHLQQTVLEVAYQLNHDVCTARDFTPLLTSKCEVSFEFGIAEDATFNYLDREELERSQKQIEIGPLPLIDLLSVIRYRTLTAKGRRSSLKSDYNMLRFAFSRRTMQLSVSHERGSQRISPEDLITFLTHKINSKLGNEAQKVPVLKHSNTL